MCQAFAVNLAILLLDSRFKILDARRIASQPPLVAFPGGAPLTANGQLFDVSQLAAARCKQSQSQLVVRINYSHSRHARSPPASLGLYKGFNFNITNARQ